MIKLEFYKVSTGGNDFIVFDNRKKIFHMEHQENLIELMSARRYGIGSDGVCLIECSDNADYQARFFSANGVENNFSGNGIRAAMRFAEAKEIAGNVQIIETRAGILTGELEEEKTNIEIPHVKKLELDAEIEIPHQFENKHVHLSYVDFGVRNLVLKVEKVSTYDIKGVGFMLGKHVNFQPDGINVSIFDVIDNHNMDVATYECGVGNLVNSSGEGAVSAFLVAEALKEITSPLIIHTWGGLHKVGRKENGNLYLEGETRVSFVGNISADMLNFDIDKVRKKHFI